MCAMSLLLSFQPLLLPHIGTEVSREASERSKEKASLDQLQKAYTELNSRKIKDPLSSFLPDIPGEGGFWPHGVRVVLVFLAIVSNR